MIKILKTNLATFLLIFAFLSLDGECHARTSISRNADVVVGDRFFGMHIHNASLTNWPNLQFSSWRLWDSGVTWSKIQPEHDGWNFDRLDSQVALAEKYSIELVLTIGLTPRWASARPNEVSPYGMGASAPPADLDNWRRYVRKLFGRYRGRIKYYQIWNEVNESTFFSGSIDQLIDLCLIASSELKELDPSARIVSPSFVGEKGLDSLRVFLSKGGGDVSVIGYHFYTPYSDPESSISSMVKVREVVDSYLGERFEIWNTETGWLTVDETDDAPGLKSYKYWKRLSSVNLAAYLVRAHVLAAANGVSRYYWYSWDHRFMGLSSGQGRAVRPGVVKAYEALNRWLVGRAVRNCVSQGDLWTCELKSSSKLDGVIAWSRSGRRVLFSIPKGVNKLVVEDIAGTKHYMKSIDDIYVEGVPLLIRPDL